MATLLAAIADDLTGATDLAGLIARSGVDVSLRLDTPGSHEMSAATVEIVALKCRTSPVDEAVTQTRAALQWLRRTGASHFYWKYCSTFDSTAKGNIGPVAEALMDDLGAGQTIYCPAFPENGRTVFMGNLFVGEQPLSESSMKDHPLTPMTDSNLVRLLQRQTSRSVGLLNRHVVAKGAEAIRQQLNLYRAEGVAHVIVDAIAYEDLVSICEACMDLPLMTGGSALAEALPALWARQGLVPHSSMNSQARRVHGPSIVLSGSCSAMTNRQVQAYLRDGHPAYRLDPILLDRNGDQDVLHWLEQQPAGAAPIIYATTDPDKVRATQNELGAERAGDLVERALGKCARMAVRLGFRRFVVAGGETSGAVARALGISQLNVGPEIVPGVPWCFAENGGDEIAIALKSGNFGKDDFFSLAFEVPSE